MFRKAIYNDTRFLHDINIVDYSIVVGLDQERRELVSGSYGGKKLNSSLFSSPTLSDVLSPLSADIRLFVRKLPRMVGLCTQGTEPTGVLWGEARVVDVFNTCASKTRKGLTLPI